MNPLMAVAAVTVAVDRVTKQLVTAHLAEGRLYGIGGGWGLRRVDNERAALVEVPVAVGVVLWGLIAAAVALVVRMAPDSATLPLVLGLGLVVGGAFGNLLDRLLRQPVVDFFAAGSWPVFNVADAAIVVGFVIALASAA